jgi:antitoxin HicB
MSDLKPRYTVTIQWSDEDHCFVVSFPEWGEFCHTHGATYAEAVQNAQEVLDMLIESAITNHEALPEPQMYVRPIAAVTAA